MKNIVSDLFERFLLDCMFAKLYNEQALIRLKLQGSPYKNSRSKI